MLVFTPIYGWNSESAKMLSQNKTKAEFRAESSPWWSFGAGRIDRLAVAIVVAVVSEVSSLARRGFCRIQSFRLSYLYLSFSTMV